LATNAAGTAASGNGGGGIRINTSGITIGGTTAAARNVVSGNGGVGINVLGSAATIQNNFIGTDVTGTIAIGNANAGIRLDLVSGCTIGGTTNGAAQRYFRKHWRRGSNCKPSTGNVVQGNFIGVSASGTTALGNTGNSVGGVSISSSNNNTIGGTVAGAGNVLSGNSGGNAYGIQISASSGTMVQGNIIGLDVSGTVKLQNVAGGIIILGGSNKRSGGRLQALAM
jgi:hypothetical protein